MTKFFALVFISLNIYCAESAYSAQSLNITREKYPYIVLQDEKSNQSFVETFNAENSFLYRVRFLVNFVHRSGEIFVDPATLSLEFAILANELIASGYLNWDETNTLSSAVIKGALKEVQKAYNPNRK